MMHQKCYQGLEEAFLFVTFFNPFHATIFSIPPERYDNKGYEIG